MHTGGHVLPVGHPVAVRAHVIEDEALPEWHEDPVVEYQEEVYKPFQGIEGLDGYSLLCSTKAESGSHAVGETTVAVEASPRRQGNGPIYQDRHGREDIFPGSGG